MTSLQVGLTQGFEQTLITANRTPSTVTRVISLIFTIFGGLLFYTAKYHKDHGSRGDVTMSYLPVECYGFALAFIQTVWAIALFKRMDLSFRHWKFALSGRILLASFHYLSLAFNQQLCQVEWILFLFAQWAVFDTLVIAAATNPIKPENYLNATKSAMDVGEAWALLSYRLNGLVDYLRPGAGLSANASESEMEQA